MKKKFDLKGLENADKDLLEKLSAKYTAVNDKEAERLYRRMTAKSDDTVDELEVKGVDVYHRPVWRKIVSVAATLVIAVGAIGGGAFYFSKLSDRKYTGSEAGTAATSTEPAISITTEPATSYDLKFDPSADVYSNLKANKDKLDMKIKLEDDSERSIPEAGGKIDDFFQYMDKYGGTKEISSEDFRTAERRMYAEFSKKGTAEYDVPFSLALFGNGYYSIEEFNGDEFRTSYYRFANGSNAFHDILLLLTNETTVERLDNMFSNDVMYEVGPMGAPQGKMCYDTNVRYYKISDKKSFLDEINSLEWETETQKEEDVTGYWEEYGYYNSYGAYRIISENISLYPKGYMTKGVQFYKLKNESDTEKLSQILDKYLVMDEASALAQKILDGVTNYDNLKAHFTYKWEINGKVIRSDSGYLSVNARIEKMYQTGEGFVDDAVQYSENCLLIMNGHDNSAYRRVRNGVDNYESCGRERYSTGNIDPPPEYHYIYLCKDIEKGLTPRYYQSYYKTRYSYESKEIDGNTEYKVTINYTDYTSTEQTSVVTILLTPNGQLLAYESDGPNYKTTFALDDYVFDSPDFTMEDVSAEYDKIIADEAAYLKQLEEKAAKDADDQQYAE